jgi:hypothetical protein
MKYSLITYLNILQNKVAVHYNFQNSSTVFKLMVTDSSKCFIIVTWKVIDNAAS